MTTTPAVSQPRSALRRIALLSILLAGLTACADAAREASGPDPDTALPTDSPSTPSVWTPKYLVVAGDAEGYVNLYGDDGVGTVRSYGSILIKQAAGTGLPLGEIHLHQGRAFVLIPSGLRDTVGKLTGGGVAIIDLAKAIVDVNDATAVEMVPLVGRLTIKSTRIEHATPEPGGNYLWINNAGLDGNTAADSVFRFNWNFQDATDSDGPGRMDDRYKDAVEVSVGDGDKRGAHAHPVDGMATVPLSYIVYDAADQTVSVVDNDHMSPTFMTSVRGFVLNDSGLGNLPGGIDYSPVSGLFYVGITSGTDQALMMISATDYALPSYTLKGIPAGRSAGQIPVGGYVRTSADGAFVYMLGYKANASAVAPFNRGYLTVIRASDNSVAQIIDLGDVAAAELRLARIKHNEVQYSKVLIPATQRGGVTDALQVIELDNVTGIMKNASAITTISVGAGHAHRSIALAPDQRRAYVPNGGDCGVTPGPDCQTITIIDLLTNTNVGSLTTRGKEARFAAVLEQ